MPKISAKFHRGHTLRGHQMQVGWVKIGDFRQIAGYILKTVQDRRMVSIKSFALYRMVTLLLTLSAPYPLQTTPFSAFRTDIHSFVTGEPRDFIFGTLAYHSTFHPTEKSSLKGAWSGSNNPFQNFTPHVISPQQLMLETSNFVHGSAM